jgi:hypothetical protein
MEDDVDGPHGVDLDSDVEVARAGDNEQEEDEEQQDANEEEEMDEDEEEDEDEDDGKEPRTIGQGEMVNTSADDVDTKVDHQPIVLPEQGQEMRENTPPPQPPAPAPRPQTPEPCPQPRTAETHSLSGLEDLGLVTPKNPAQRCQVCKKMRQPETPRMWMWISSCSANQHVATVSLMSLSPISLSPMFLSPTSFRLRRPRFAL